MFQNAEAAGAADVDAFAVIVKRSSSTKVRHRDLRRKLLKNRCWPKPYLFSAPCTEPETQEELSMKIPMRLPQRFFLNLPWKSTCDRLKFFPIPASQTFKAEKGLQLLPTT